MNENQFAILRGCCQNFGDWPRWDILSDAFRDEGDDVGADWALWVKEKQRWPSPSYMNTISNRGFMVVEFSENRWRWLYQYVVNQTIFDGLPNSLFYAVQPDEDSFSSPPSKTQEDAFVQLLNGWRSLTEDGRKILWDWKPNRS